MTSASRIVIVFGIFFPMGLFYYSSANGADYTISARNPTAALAYRPRRQRPDSPGRRHWIRSLGVDFKWSRV